MYFQKKNTVSDDLFNKTHYFNRDNLDDFRRLTGLFLNLKPKNISDGSYFWREIAECEDLIKDLEYEIGKCLKSTDNLEVHDKQEDILVYLETKTFKDLLYNRLHYIKYIKKEIEICKQEFCNESDRLSKIEEDERLRKLPKIEK